MVTSRIARASFSFLAASLIASSAFAEFAAPADWTRGDLGTTYQSWNTFSHSNNANAYDMMGNVFPNGDPSPHAANLPDVANLNPNGDAGLLETTGTAIITGTGNLYSAFGPVSIGVTVPTDVDGPEDYVTAIVQIRMNGTLDPNSVLLNGENWIQFGNISDAEKWMLFNIPYATFTGSDLALSFSAGSPNSSLDRVSIDTFRGESYVAVATVPEPASLGALAGGAVLALRRRRD